MPKLRVNIRFDGTFRDRAEERDFTLRVHDGVAALVESIAADYNRIRNPEADIDIVRDRRDREPE